MNEDLFVDEFVRFRLAKPPASKGHVQILPVQNVNSFEDLSDEAFIALFQGASTVATALFELLGAHGTNIICSDFGRGIVVDVVARSENDGLNFLWQPVPANPSQLESVGKSIKDKVDELFWARQNPSAIKKSFQPSSLPVKELEESDDGRVNYLLKSLRRTP